MKQQSKSNNEDKQKTQTEIDSIISHPLQSRELDYSKLVQIGKKSGFLTKENRKKVWPILLKVDIDNIPATNIFDESKKSKFYDQVKKDVDRSISFLDSFKNQSHQAIEKKQTQLFFILEGLIQQQPEFQYYQGYHDIATIFLLLFGIRQDKHQEFIIQKLTFIFHEYTDPLTIPFEHSSMLQVNMIHRIVKLEDKYLGEVLDQIEGPMFAFSWILTWFAHSFTDQQQVHRIFDYLLCSEPYTILFLSSSLILNTKESLRERLDACEEGAQVGVAYMFFQNAHLCQLTLDWNKLIEDCELLQEKYSIESILKDLPFSRDSILMNDHIDEVLSYRKQTKNKSIGKIVSKFINRINWKSTGITMSLASAVIIFQATRYINLDR